MDLSKLFYFFSPSVKRNRAEIWPILQSLLKLLHQRKDVEWVKVLNALGPLCLWQRFIGLRSNGRSVYWTYDGKRSIKTEVLIILNLDNRVPQNHKSNSFGVTTAWHVWYRVLINLEIGKLLSHCRAEQKYEGGGHFQGGLTRPCWSSAPSPLSLRQPFQQTCGGTVNWWQPFERLAIYFRLKVFQAIIVHLARLWMKWGRVLCSLRQAARKGSLRVVRPTQCPGQLT